MEDAIKKLEEQVKCPVCLETYTNPRILQCSHVYCQMCLIGLVQRNQGAQGHHLLTCPECRGVTPTPPNGVVGLQPARLANSLIEFLVDAKKAGAVKIHHCPEHGKELEFFCYDCGECLCHECACKHCVKYIHEALENYKCTILPDLEHIQADCDFTQLPEVFKADMELALAKSRCLIDLFKVHLIIDDTIEALTKLWITEKRISDKLDKVCFAEGIGLEVAMSSLIRRHDHSRNVNCYSI